MVTCTAENEEIFGSVDFVCNSSEKKISVGDLILKRAYFATRFFHETVV